MIEKTGRVWLVGAGCGGPELLTLRGWTLLRRCQAVVYDDLIDQSLLDFVPVEAPRIYMGKRGGAPSAAQADICAALIRLAREGREVVRLKGGDPFVFGRGGEELEALREAGIPCGEVPGISSAIAIPAAAGIPVTYRRLSRSVHIVTAHTAGTEGGLPEDFDRLADLEGTLVFLMGLGRLEEIVRRLIGAGKNPETPAAVLSGGNAARHAAVRGPLRHLPQLAREAGAEAPAVIVVGAVAALELGAGADLPLAGMKVGLTGTPALLRKLEGPLRELGARVSRLLTLEVEPRPFSLPDLEEGSWLAFTSANGVRRFFQALAEARRDVRTLAGCRFAVVGAATGKALAGYGVYADLCPEESTTDALGKALLRSVPPESPLYLLRSAQADGALRALLEAAGRRVRDFRIYDVRPRRGEGGAAAMAALTHLAFGSAGGVRAFWEAYGAPPEGCTCVCVGPVTAAALKQWTKGPVLTANEISAEGILQAVLEDAAARRGR